MSRDQCLRRVMEFGRPDSSVSQTSLPLVTISSSEHSPNAQLTFAETIRTQPTRSETITCEMPGLWTKTPLIYSKYMSSRIDCDVYLKLEHLQPSQSFKYRGVSLFAEKALEKYGPDAHLIVASGGNAGFATCKVAEALSMKCSVYITEEARPMAPLVEATGAKVYVGGDCYSQALDAAKAAVAADPAAVLVPAYDHPTLWEGHSSLIQEISGQLPGPLKPDAIVCAVGGGGLLGGVIKGCETVGWDDVPILGMETHLSNCFYQSFLANKSDSKPHPDATGNPATLKADEAHGVVLAYLDRLTSRASCLGATSPSPGVLKMALGRKGPVECICVSDEQAMATCVNFLEDHKMMVELACSTALAPGYDPRIIRSVLPVPENNRRPTLVFIVCGGIKVSLDEVVEYRNLAGRTPIGSQEFWLNGQART